VTQARHLGMIYTGGSSYFNCCYSDSHYSNKRHSDWNSHWQTCYYALHSRTPGGDNVVQWTMILYLILQLRFSPTVTI